MSPPPKTILGFGPDSNAPPRLRLSTVELLLSGMALGLPTVSSKPNETDDHDAIMDNALVNHDAAHIAKVYWGKDIFEFRVTVSH